MDKRLTEYPRMQMVRDSYLSLNGEWEYAFRPTSDIPDNFDGLINVPFSPEAKLSGIHKTLKPGEFLFYRKVFTLPEGFLKNRIFLHFGAVDQIATVYLNGIEVGSHSGGFLPFSFELSQIVKEENILIVKVLDLTDKSYLSRGKQKIRHGNIWYPPQSGIYLPVWLESTPHTYISRLKITPQFDEGNVEITVFSETKMAATIIFEGRNYVVEVNTPFLLTVPNFKAWSPRSPHLYAFSVKLENDEVHSYFAMRKVHVGLAPDGYQRIFLNNEVLFQSGLLDQGYYHDGLLTPPHEEAVINDILMAQKMGFNVLRKHIKLEWERFYYHCDRLGMLVWQDFVNGGERYSLFAIHAPALFNITLNDTRGYHRFGRKNPLARAMFYEETKKTIEYLYNYPSIVLWTVFNEGWGQFDSKELLAYVLTLDQSRLIDLVSGWHDQGHGDFLSRHVYFKPYLHKADKKGRAVILSEFGGYSHRVPGHTYTRKNFGYRHFKDLAAFETAFTTLYEKEIIPSVKEGLAAAIYTQLSDVEEEVNGLITYDREVVKINSEVVLKLNKKLW